MNTDLHYADPRHGIPVVAKTSLGSNDRERVSVSDCARRGKPTSQSCYRMRGVLALPVGWEEKWRVGRLVVWP